jgi:hypothetical protein
VFHNYVLALLAMTKTITLNFVGLNNIVSQTIFLKFPLGIFFCTWLLKVTMKYSNQKFPKHFNKFAIFYNWQVMVIIDQLIYGSQVLVMDHELQHKQASKFMVDNLIKFPYLNPMWVHSQLGFQKGVSN